MDQERKLPNDVARKQDPATRIYEVIVKFHKDGKPIIEAFLLANMISVTISHTENSDVLLAYCQFQGDIKTLDSKLAALRQSAMVVLGDTEEKFLDFFVALRQLSQPLPRLLALRQPGVLAGFLKPTWAQGLLVALGLFVVWGVTTIMQGYSLPWTVSSRTTNAPPTPLAAPVSTVSQWNPYVLPQYHQAWIEVKKKHGLSQEMVTALFRRIKQIDKYGPGQALRDLTIYPQVIDRALGLIILKDVSDYEGLQTLRKTLEGYSAHWEPLPDRNRELQVFDEQSRAFDDQVVLVFYEELLKEPHREFTERLIQELRRTHLSGN